MKNETEHFDKFLRLAGEEGYFRKTLYPTNSNVGCILLLIAVVT